MGEDHVFTAYKRHEWTREIRTGFTVVIRLWGTLGQCVGCELEENWDPKQREQHDLLGQM